MTIRRDILAALDTPTSKLRAGMQEEFQRRLRQIEQVFASQRPAVPATTTDARPVGARAARPVAADPTPRTPTAEGSSGVRTPTRHVAHPQVAASRVPLLAPVKQRPVAEGVARRPGSSGRPAGAHHNATERSNP